MGVLHPSTLSAEAESGPRQAQGDSYVEDGFPPAPRLRSGLKRGKDKRARERHEGRVNDKGGGKDKMGAQMTEQEVQLRNCWSS